MKLHQETFGTQLGPFTVSVDESGAVVATAFGRTGRPAGSAGKPPAAGAPCRAAREQIKAYLAGSRRTFSLRLALAGTPFQRRVWAELAGIPFGETRSYGEIARKLGTSARAIGRAAGANPACLLIPCHRVIGADGSLTGFAYGLKAKAWLLRHEGII
jgi:methylated-DNA-[protein]-cysteine S-methyltransferase